MGPLIKGPIQASEALACSSASAAAQQLFPGGLMGDWALLLRFGAMDGAVVWFVFGDVDGHRCVALSYQSLCLDDSRDGGCRSNSLSRESGSGVKGCGALVLAGSVHCFTIDPAE
jgi:hypothetical protein